MKPTLHFVYSVPYRPSTIQHIIDAPRLIAARYAGLPNLKPWRYGEMRAQVGLVHAPDSITINLVNHLKKSYNLLLYDLNEHIGSIHYSPNDIVVGHVSRQEHGIMNRILRSGKTARAKVMLQPFSHGLLSENGFTLDYIPRCDAYIALCGSYWIDTIHSSAYAPFADKFFRIDMAVDAGQFPLLKKTFNPVGSRRLIYIGHNFTPSKGCAYLSELARLLPGVEFGWIGDGDPIEGVKHISGRRELSPQYMSSICETYDFFITMGVSDANPTTILEAMAWGLPVLCTPQSGYYNLDPVLSTSLHDMQKNVDLITSLQQASAEDLQKMSHANRDRVCKSYTWNRFTMSFDRILCVILNRKDAGTRHIATT